MKISKGLADACLCVLLINFCATSAAPAWPQVGDVNAATPIAPVDENKPVIQMAILLDTSGSMSGLIDQARTELWAIVNEFIFARKNGKVPELQVALYEYGKSSLARKQGYIRRIVPLTTDLDKVSEELFALKTNGGSEYCGWVIKQAAEALQWSDSPDELKVIFIAGNEPFTQGPVDYQKACKQAASRGIIVNTIHCGPEQQGISGKWKEGALLADGEFMNINHNRRVVHIQAPQDNEISQLGTALNETYIPYGAQAEHARVRQAKQDKNAAAVAKEAMVQRAVTKSSVHYRNETWDMVDAIANDKLEFEQLKDEELPKEMQKMNTSERKAYVEQKSKHRSEIQEKIQQLNQQRKTYVAEQMQKNQEQHNTLGSAIILAIRRQALRLNFKFQPAKETQQKPEHTD